MSVCAKTPYGPLRIIGMHGCEENIAKVDEHLKQARGDDDSVSYQLPVSCPRFATGEAKGLLGATARGQDLFILVDCFNYAVSYKMREMTVPMSPDDHYQDLKRVIAATGGKSRRITVFMPMLYEGRQHRRSSRESLDCALALQELMAMGVTNIITFDAHDPRVQNAIPNGGFDNVHPTYQMLKTLVHSVPDVRFNCERMMIVSPDEGSMSRSIYYSSVLGLDLGMFYKRRDYTTVVNGRNPIVAQEFLGDNVAGKDVIVPDDMIASGDSMFGVSKMLKELGARRIFIFSTFGLFTAGLERFDEYHREGIIDKVFTTNLVYSTPELRTRAWYESVDMSKYIALLIDTLNYDDSISSLLSPVERISKLLEAHR